MFKFDANISDKIAIPVIRRVMPTIIANEINGVSPMVGPSQEWSVFAARIREYNKLLDGGKTHEEALAILDDHKTA